MNMVLINSSNKTRLGYYFIHLLYFISVHVHTFVISCNQISLKLESFQHIHFEEYRQITARGASHKNLGARGGSIHVSFNLAKSVF